MAVTIDAKQATCSRLPCVQRPRTLQKARGRVLVFGVLDAVSVSRSLTIDVDETSGRSATLCSRSCWSCESAIDERGNFCTSRARPHLMFALFQRLSRATAAAAAVAAAAPDTAKSIEQAVDPKRRTKRTSLRSVTGDTRWVPPNEWHFQSK